MVRVDVPLEPGVRLTVGGLKEVAGPLVTDGDTVADRPTLPVNPMLFSVMVEVAELPATKLAGVGAPAEIVKSAVTVTITVAV